MRNFSEKSCLYYNIPTNIEKFHFLPDKVALLMRRRSECGTKIKECRFGVLLEISDIFSSKLNVFNYMI